jgi:putative ribosome biogenesis GTPase RsgA
MWELRESSHQHINSMSHIRRSSEQIQQHQRALNTLYPYVPMTGAEPLIPSQPQETIQQIYIAEPDEDPMQHLVLVPLGKTGAGKSSLLNIMLGYDEFKAKAAAKVKLSIKPFFLCGT